jgi:molecular chaperone DnaK (HSP70)
VTVGNTARKALIETPERVIYSVKRLMGRGLSEIQDELKLFPFRLADDVEAGEVPRIQLGEMRFTPPEISAYILRQLKRNAERFFGAPVTQAVITVPAYFNDAQRQATKDAGRMAGLEVLRLVNEPTAAALAYGLDAPKRAPLRYTTWAAARLIFRYSSCAMGSSKCNRPMATRTWAATTSTTCCSPLHLTKFTRSTAWICAGIRALCRRCAKPRLRPRSACPRRMWQGSILNCPTATGISARFRAMCFELLIEPVLERTAGPCKQALADAGITPEQIDEVVLVGVDAYSRRAPTSGRSLSSHARGKKPHIELNPDEVVALGAAVQADILAGASKTTEEMLLLDVTPLSLGIEALGGTVARIIQRNSTIPASATEHFTTGVEGQTNVAIHVVQGERELAADCRSLARFDLKGIPPMSAGLPRIEVKFLIDADGILKVTAREQRSGQARRLK